MGNRCCKQKDKPLLETSEYSLKQITVEKWGNCDICNAKNIEGYYTQSVIADKSIFICWRCKNLK